MKKIAVVIVNYKCSDDTIDCIRSLERFDTSIFDVFVVDNNSGKEDLEKLRPLMKERRINLIELGENIGFAGANNVAINEALKIGYPYIFLLNPDTLIEDEKFFEVLKRELISSGAGIIGPLIRYYPEKERIYFAGGFINKFTGMTIMKDKGKIMLANGHGSVECDFITGCAIMIKSEVFKQIGLLPEDYFLYFEESDFCTVAKRQGIKIVLTAETCLFHKTSSSIGYLSDEYLYYMIRNQRKFSKRYLPWRYKPIGWLFFYCIWCPGYILLTLRKGNPKGVKAIFKGMWHSHRYSWSRSVL